MKNLTLLTLLFLNIGAFAQVKIGNNPTTINSASILEIEDTLRGVLLPRMTKNQRDSISIPPDGLKIYNTQTSTMDVYRFDHWASTKYDVPNDKLIYVYSIDDLPDPLGSSITLDTDATYLFMNIVDISPYYLELNGAVLRGLDPEGNGVASNVSGGILRSTDKSVFMKELAVIPLSATTKAYDFSDGTGTKFCNIFSGNSVVEVGIPSLGVGQVSGFKAITILDNYWKCADGIKVTGNVGKFAAGFVFIDEITAGAGIEFLGGLIIEDIDLSNNYFQYTGQTGVKVNAAAQIDRGRMTTNMFRGVGTVLDGVTPFDLGWNMAQNTNIQNTVSYGYIYMNNNATATTLPANDTYVKLNGVTSSVKLLKFQSNIDNRLTYKGKEGISAKVFVTITGKAPANSAEFTLSVSKNGTPIANPNQSTGSMVNNQTFTLVLETHVDMRTDDYIEPVIKTTSGNLSITITDVQFRISD